MGRIEIDLFSTLDGVMQAPGGPDEDRGDGFAYGGWQVPFEDEAIGADVVAGIQRLDALLLGRRTYDIFAGYWPHHLDGPEGGIGRLLDAAPKYVASRGGVDLSWRDSHRLGDDLAAEVAGLRDRHDDVHVIGSVELSRWLVAHGLFDRLNLWVYPVVLGAGKRLFPDDGPPLGLELLEPAVSTPTGGLILHYGPGPVPTTGDMADAR